MRIRRLDKVFLTLIFVIVVGLHFLWRSSDTEVTSSAISSTISSSTPKSTFKPRTWLRISRDMYVYSAFLEGRKGGGVGSPKENSWIQNGQKGVIPYIKVLGLKRIKKTSTPPPVVQHFTKVWDVPDMNEKYLCKLFYRDAAGTFRGLESWNLTYFVFEEGVKTFAGCFYKCFFSYIPLDSSHPLFVALYPRNVRGYPDKILQVQITRAGTEKLGFQGQEMTLETLEMVSKVGEPAKKDLIGSEKIKRRLEKAETLEKSGRMEKIEEYDIQRRKETEESEKAWRLEKGGELDKIGNKKNKQEKMGTIEKAEDVEEARDKSKKLEKTWVKARESDRPENKMKAGIPGKVEVKVNNDKEVEGKGRESHKQSPGEKESYPGETNDEEPLSVCVRPLFGPMDDLIRLAQFISYYEAVGVSRFTFYDLSITERVRGFLEALPNVKLMSWNLPTGNTSDLWDYGTLTALHDCLYQQTRGFVVVVDIDEYIVPAGGRNLGDLLGDSLYRLKDQFIFHNVFFCDEFCSNSHSESVVLPAGPIPPITKGGSSRGNAWSKWLLPWLGPISNSTRIFPLLDGSSSSPFPIFSCTRRTKRIWGTHDRTKFIVRAQAVLSLGHHFVTSFTSPVMPIYSEQTFYVPKSTALLNHYRKCRSISGKRNPIYQRTQVVDGNILHFQARMEHTNSFRVFRTLINGGTHHYERL